MAGEFKIAKQLMDDALEEAAAHRYMSEDAMNLAILREVISRLSTSNSKQQLADLIHFNIASIQQAEHVITRGC